jgi:hypothetical protein
VATPTWWRVPALSYSPRSSEPTPPAVLVPAEAGDDAVGGALVLDLEHQALVGDVGEVAALGDHPVEAGALEAGEPVGRDLGSDVAGVRWTGASALASASTRRARRSEKGRDLRSSSPRARRSKATKLAGVCSASSATRDAAGVDAVEQGVEVEPPDC